MNVQACLAQLTTLHRRPGLRVVLIAAAIFWVIALGLTLHTYLNFYPSEATYDRGIFNQVFWNGTNGNFFQSSLSSSLSAEVVQAGELPRVDYHRLGQHFTPALLLWLPFYAIAPNVITLIVLQVTLITAAGLVLFTLAREYVEPSLAATLSISFYCATAVIGPTLQNFHDFSQLPLFIFTMLLALKKRWWWLYALCAILVPMAREDSGVILFGFGAFLAVSRKAPKLGIGLCAYSVAYVLLVTNWAMPMFSTDVSDRFAIERFGQYVDSDSASTLDLIWAMVRRPWILGRELFTPFGRTLSYLSGQWLPLAFIPMISPAAWIAAGPPLLLLLLAQGETVLSITTRYALGVTPGLFYGAILWWSAHPKQFRPRFRRFWSLCLALSIVFTITPNPHRTFSFAIPDSLEPRVYVSPFAQWRHAGDVRHLMAMIPADVSVSATSHIVPHLSSRREVLRLPRLQLTTDSGEAEMSRYAIADFWQLEQYQPAFQGDRRRLRQISERFDRLLSNEQYGVIAIQNGVVLLQKDVPSDDEAASEWTDYLQHINEVLDS